MQVHFFLQVPDGKTRRGLDKKRINCACQTNFEEIYDLFTRVFSEFQKNGRGVMFWRFVSYF